MKRTIPLIAGTTLLAGASQLALAQEKNPEASISLGYVATSGNTETQTFTGEFLMEYDRGSWTHNIKFQAVGSSEDGESKAEYYYLEDKSDYNLDEMQYLYLKGTYKDDRFSGFDHQASASAGYGRHLISNERFELEAYGGLGYRWNKLEIGDNEDEGIVTVGEKFAWMISDNTDFTQSLDVEIGEEITVTTFEVALESVIVDRVSSKIAFQARNNSDVPPEVENTDTILSVSLVYDF